MSEYIEIAHELTADPDVMRFRTNLRLGENEVEVYDSIVALEEGSPVAQALAMIDGIVALRIEGQELLVTRDPLVEWYYIAADISAALKEFFL